MKLPQKRLLDKGKIEKLVFALGSIESAHAEVLEKIRTEAEYFATNARRMRYPRFRRPHWFVGSDVIEAGCKTVIGSRLKPSGMRHARTQACSGRFAVPTPSSPCAAATSTAGWRTTGRLAGRPDLHFYVARVRPYGADHQWVKVPRQEESVCLGS